MKKVILGFVIGLMIGCSVPALAGNAIQAVIADVNVKINGQAVTFAEGETPVIVNDRTYVPAKYVAEGLGATVKWDGKTKTVDIVGNKVTNSASSTTPESQTLKDIVKVFDPHEDRNGAMNLVEKASDGMNVYVFNNEPQKYVLSNDLNRYISKVKMGITKGCTEWSDNRALKTADGKTDLIPILEYYMINDMKYFTLDYYENVMLPIIKAQ